jgi:PAS domain S-box-containing protein
MYGEVDDARNTFFVPRDWKRHGPSHLAGNTFPIDAFGPEVGAAGRAGQVIAINDVRTDPRSAGVQQAYLQLMGITASLLVPLVRQGRLLAFLALGQEHVHYWSDAEIELARSVASRIWSTVDLARTQAALDAERDRSQLILDSIAEGFVLIAPDWTVLQINGAGERLTNRTAAEVVGRHHWDIWADTHDTDTGRMFERVMRTRETGITQLHHVGDGGSGHWLEVRGYPTRDGGMVSVFRDITARKRVEEQLHEADRRKDEFLAMLAHELRNPLAPISAAADLLKIGRLDEARLRQSSAIIGRQVRHMTSLVDDLLDVSRVTRGLVTLARAPVSARTMVDEAIEQVRPMFDARRQRLVVDLRDPDATVLGDRARLVQVLANLLNNAAKYTPEERRIEVEARAADGLLTLAVRDQGIGIEPALTAHVFDLFTQATRSADRAQGGLGLGLALVKHLVELHGGSVACSSPGLGQGSSFVVTLPLMQPALAPAPNRADAQQQAAGTQALRVLVVDDNIDAAATLGMLLEACGHEVAVEHDSHSALARARSWRPDAALLDIGLPEMDGNELARRLRADPASAAIVLIAVTGYGQEQDRRNAFEAGFDHHLVKPVDLDRLAGLLAEIQASRST